MTNGPQMTERRDLTGIDWRKSKRKAPEFFVKTNKNKIKDFEVAP